MLRVIQEKKLSRREAFEEKAKSALWRRPPPDPAVWPLIEKSAAQKWLDIGCSFSEKWARVAKAATLLDAQEKPFESVQECFPYTSFPDGAFDGVLYLDQIGTLDEELHRLALSELARLLKPGGTLICSTPLDVQTLSPALYFKALVKTEFQIVEEHARYLRFGSFFERVAEIFLKESCCTHLTIVGKKKILYS